MVLYSVYKDCDPLSAHYISGSDQILPLYVMNHLGSLRGMPGLFVAGIFAASLGLAYSNRTVITNRITFVIYAYFASLRSYSISFDGFRTVASALNSLAAITCEDVLQGLFNMELPARKGATYARWISIFFGVFGFALIFVVERLGSVLQVDRSLKGSLIVHD